MHEPPTRFPRIGRCDACGRAGRINARICVDCHDGYGRRIAELLARARRDPKFAEACLRSMTPGARARFESVLRVAAPALKPPTKARPTRVSPKPGVHKCTEDAPQHLRIVRPIRSA